MLDFQGRLLRRALEICGDAVALRIRLGADEHSLKMWLDGKRAYQSARFESRRHRPRRTTSRGRSRIGARPLGSASFLPKRERARRRRRRSSVGGGDRKLVPDTGGRRGRLESALRDEPTPSESIGHAGTGPRGEAAWHPGAGQAAWRPGEHDSRLADGRNGDAGQRVFSPLVDILTNTHRSFGLAGLSRNEYGPGNEPRVRGMRRGASPNRRSRSGAGH